MGVTPGYLLEDILSERRESKVHGFLLCIRRHFHTKRDRGDKARWRPFWGKLVAGWIYFLTNYGT